MTNTKKPPEPLSGDSLVMVKNAIGQKTTAMLYLHGLSSVQWVNNCKIPAGQLGGQHAMLARLLLKRPELCPLPVPPSGKEVYEELVKLDPTFAPRQFPVLLGMEPGSKDRLLDDDENHSAVLYSLLTIIKMQLDACSTVKEKRAFFDFLRETTEEEAMSRGLDSKRVWVKGGWRKSVKEAQARAKLEQEKLEGKSNA